ncbi:hypothetical protein NL676_030117 [Syzygium grande]|nr:hypothetical protein NL676_030117 [Syzygium grande]
MSKQPLPLRRDTQIEPPSSLTAIFIYHQIWSHGHIAQPLALLPPLLHGLLGSLGAATNLAVPSARSGATAWAVVIAKLDSQIAKHPWK